MAVGAGEDGRTPASLWEDTSGARPGLLGTRVSSQSTCGLAPCVLSPRGSGHQGFGAQHPLRGIPHLQYSLSTKRSSPDDGNDVSPYSLSPVSNKR